MSIIIVGIGQAEFDGNIAFINKLFHIFDETSLTPISLCKLYHFF